MRIILFNGPPGSGKDTAAQSLYWHWFLVGQCHFDRMSFPNKAAFAAITDTEMDEFHNNLTYEKIKEEPLALLNGKSYRQWQIEFSENYMKPMYGNDIFGRLFCNRTAARAKHIDYMYQEIDTIVIPDCGFEVEAEYLSLVYQVFLIRIHREGKTFANDSRSYIRGYSIPQSRIVDVRNDGTISEFEGKIAQLIGNLLP